MATNNSSHYARDSLFDLSSTTAIVTGGSTGIGLMCAQTLMTNGAKVYIVGRRKEKIEAAIKAHSSGPGSLHALPGDVTDKKDVLRLVQEIQSKEPSGIQLLINNAGVARDDKTKFCETPRLNISIYLTDASLQAKKTTDLQTCPTPRP